MAYKEFGVDVERYNRKTRITATAICEDDHDHFISFSTDDLTGFRMHLSPDQARDIGTMLTEAAAFASKRVASAADLGLEDAA